MFIEFANRVFPECQINALDNRKAGTKHMVPLHLYDVYSMSFSTIRPIQFVAA